MHETLWCAGHARSHTHVFIWSINSDGGVKVKCCQAIWITGHRGFQSTGMRGKGAATRTKMSVTDAQCEGSEGCVLLGEEGGMTRNERAADKEMDEAGRETEKGERSEITQMKTSRNGERGSSQSPKKYGVGRGMRGHKAEV